MEFTGFWWDQVLIECGFPRDDSRVSSSWWRDLVCYTKHSKSPYLSKFSNSPYLSKFSKFIPEGIEPRTSHLSEDPGGQVGYASWLRSRLLSSRFCLGRKTERELLGILYHSCCGRNKPDSYRRFNLTFGARACGL
ncbi:hypothetical protein ACS0TY_016890 [Phlomoides rotata]